MFDLDTGKLLIVAVLALIVIGPKDLPRVMRQVGQSVGKLRRMASEFQGQFMDAIKDAEIDDIRKELKEIEKDSALNYDFNPVRDVHSELSGAMNTVVSEPSVASPVKDFTLPEVPLAAEPELTLLAEGIAPAMAEAEEAEVATLTEPASTPFEERPKRKLFVKAHQSRFARMNSDRTAQLTGQAISIRRRIVRARNTVSQDAVPS